MNEINEMVSIILKAGDDKKAFDIKLLKVGKITTIADYFVILSGNSDVQVKAISDEIEDRMAKHGYRLKNKEGRSNGRWILLDFKDVIVHVFHKEDREYYNLDSLWVDAIKEDVNKYI